MFLSGISRYLLNNAITVLKIYDNLSVATMAITVNLEYAYIDCGTTSVISYSEYSLLFYEYEISMNCEKINWLFFDLLVCSFFSQEYQNLNELDDEGLLCQRKYTNMLFIHITIVFNRTLT